MPLELDQVLHNRYRIKKMIGQGGFGTVYRAWDTALNQPCALKENLDTSEEAQRQFQREATILAGLRHPNLPRVIDHFFIPDQGQYLVMDFVEGQNLKAMVVEHNSPLQEEEVMGWMGQVLSALEYLHSHKPAIIHRDIKPQNIIITPQGLAMLVDFGISKIYDPNASTTSGAKAVTPGFASPEQYGTGRTDPRSDIYSLAATLYYMTTGKPPPDALDRLVHGTALPAPRQLNPALDSNMEQAILKGLEPESTKRFQSAGDFRQALSLPEITWSTSRPVRAAAPRTAPAEAADSHLTHAISESQLRPAPQPTPSAAAQPGVRPRGVANIAVLCFLSGALNLIAGFSAPKITVFFVATSLLGFASGALLLQGKNLGRRLALVYFILLSLLTLSYVSLIKG